jgi:hypothetical protein
MVARSPLVSQEFDLRMDPAAATPAVPMLPASKAVKAAFRDPAFSRQPTRWRGVKAAWLAGA